MFANDHLIIITQGVIITYTHKIGKRVDHINQARLVENRLWDR